MSTATAEHLAALSPYIAGGEPDERGEIDIHCPLHGDANRSASINVNKGVWYCHAGCGGGSIRQLVESQPTWKPVPSGAIRRRSPIAAGSTGPEKYSHEDIRSWQERLLDDRFALDQLLRRKGIKYDTAIRAQMGWNGRYYKLPVFSPERDIWNIRTYDMKPANGRRKIWSVKGMGQARLYPIGPLTRTVPHQAVLITEGEWDTLLALQAGYIAVTRTDGAGKPWHDEWTHYFEDRRIVICPDRDTTGMESAERTAEALRDVAQSVKFINLPFSVKKKDGGDLSDYMLASERADWYCLGNLMASASNTLTY
jgi:hypothetical protein